jgi:phosphoglycolate phosphatase
MRFAAVLFDLDGTLLDTLEDIADAANAVLASLGLPTHPLAAYKLFVGEGVRRLLEKALPKTKRDAAIVAIGAERFNDEYARRWNAKTRPYDGIAELLASLRDRQLPLAVLSNKPQSFTEQCVDHYFPAGTFTCVLGQREGIPPKPDPAGALETASRLSLPPDKIAYLGDSSIDMQTAVRAGMHPIGAAWGFRSREELLASGAAAVIERPDHLLAVLGE